MVAASAETLAIIGFAKDLGATMTAEVCADSSAALGIAQRAGVGKVRHLRAQGLWVQEARSTGRIAYSKVLGTKNPSDILTKYLQAELMNQHIKTIGGRFESGRADAAPMLGALSTSDEEIWSHVEYYVEELNSMGGMHVSFNDEVSFRPIPWMNKGRKAGSAVKTRATSIATITSATGTGTAVRSCTVEIKDASTPRGSSTTAAEQARGSSQENSCGTCGATSAKRSPASAVRSQTFTPWFDFDDEPICVECAGRWGDATVDSFELSSCELGSYSFSRTSPRNHFVFACACATGYGAGNMQSSTNCSSERVGCNGQNKNQSSNGTGHDSKGERSECSLRTIAIDRESINRNDIVSSTVDIADRVVYVF